MRGVVCCVTNSIDSEWNSVVGVDVDAVLFIRTNEECDDFERGVSVGQFDRLFVGHIVPGDDM